MKTNVQGACFEITSDIATTDGKRCVCSRCKNVKVIKKIGKKSYE